MIFFFAQVKNLVLTYDSKKPEYKFLIDKTSPSHKYYHEYLSRLKKIRDADDMLNSKIDSIEKRRINIRRKCLTKAEIKRCNLTKSEEEKISKIFNSIRDKANQDNIIRAKIDLDNLDFSVNRCRDLFSFCNMKLFAEKLAETSAEKLVKPRLHFLYLINEIVASTKTKNLIDGLMTTRGNEPCNLHVSLALCCEVLTFDKQVDQVLNLIDVWADGKYLPRQAIKIFDNTHKEWSTVLSNWLRYTEENLSSYDKQKLEFDIKQESKAYDVEHDKARREHRDHVIELKIELDNLGKKFLRKGKSSYTFIKDDDMENYKKSPTPPRRSPTPEFEKFGKGRSRSRSRSISRDRYSRSESRRSRESPRRRSISPYDRTPVRRRDRSRSPQRRRSRHDSERSRDRFRDERPPSRNDSVKDDLPRHSRSRSVSPEKEDYDPNDDQFYDSDDDRFLYKVPWYETPAAAMMKLIELHEHDVTKPLNPNKLKRTVVKQADQAMLAEAFRDFYSSEIDVNRNEDGWTPRNEKYSLDAFLEKKATAAKVKSVESAGKGKVPAFY